ncbi:MAG TPA: FHA domain-containing protein [bacterium]|nr:FHA domain-containing protein [bacterium]
MTHPPSEAPGSETRIYRPHGSGPRLRVVSGLAGATGREFPLDAAVMTIGRRSDQAIVLSSPSVSRAHARIEIGPQGAVIIDLGSTNGTLVNTLRLRGARALLRRGDRIGIGPVVLEYVASP